MTEETTETQPSRFTLESIYQITQIIAFIAIIASLFAIYSQINQATKMERAAAEREMTQRVADYARDFEFDETGPFLIALHDWNSANYEARFTVDKKVTEYFTITAASWRMHKQGFISANTLLADEAYLISLLRTPGGQTYWAYKQHRLVTDYVDYLNARMDALEPDFPDMFESEPHLTERLNDLLAAQGERTSVDTALTGNELVE